MPAWTTPADWTEGETVTATKLDTHVKDNTTHLYDWLGELGFTNMSSNTTVASGSETTLATLNLTIPAGGRNVKVTVSGYFASTVDDDTVTFKLYFGSDVKASGRRKVTTDTAPPTNITLVRRISAPASGSQTFVIKAQRTAGSGTVTAYHNDNYPTYILVEAL